MEKNFGTRVRQARHKAGLTQAALAEKLNLDETTISRIENGSQATSFATMLNFSEALDVKFDYLICDYLDDSYVQNGCVYFTDAGLQEYIAKCTHRAKPVEKSATYRKLRSVRA